MKKELLTAIAQIKEKLYKDIYAAFSQSQIARDSNQLVIGTRFVKPGLHLAIRDGIGVFYGLESFKFVHGLIVFNVTLHYDKSGDELKNVLEFIEIKIDEKTCEGETLRDEHFKLYDL